MDKMNFQKSVLLVAIILLVICLVLIGIALYNEKFNSDFPPVVADCPDFWVERPLSNSDDLNSDENKSTCYNVKGLGRSNCDKSMDFSGSAWTGNEGICNKYKWATACDLTWDGITNATDPCNTNSDDTTN
jgi:hypothetical protein